MSTPNYLADRTASEILAARIRTWWHRRGVYPKVWTEKEFYKGADGHMRFVWVVRSTLTPRVPKDIFAV